MQTWKRNISRQYAVGFYLAVGLILLFSILRLRPWFNSGGMWAEMATNYYIHASSANWREWLLATDAGYWPLPQRILAATVDHLSVPAAYIPLLYNTLAALGTSLCVAAFAHPHFRPVIPHDRARFLLCLLWGCAIDFETRTFINFTYTIALLVTLCSIRSMAQPEARIPRWYWLLPVLLISKPAVLVAFGTMLMAAWCAPGRMRTIALLGGIAASAQLLVLKASKSAGVMAQPNDLKSGPVELFLSMSGHAVGYLGNVAIGQDMYARLAAQPLPVLLLPGALTLILSIRTAWRSKSRSARACVFGGSCLLFGSMALNTVALHGDWNADLHKLRELGLYRHVIVAFWGGTLILAGWWLGQWQTTESLEHGKKPMITWLVTLGLIIVGLLWMNTGWRAARPYAAPLLGSSDWQQQASMIEKGAEPICVLVDPFLWGLYGKDCIRLNPEDVLRGPWQYLDGPQEISVPIPPSVKYRDVLALAVAARSNDRRPKVVRATVVAVDGAPLASGQFGGERGISASGQAMVLRTVNAMKASHSVTLRFSAPVQLLHMQDAEGNWKVTTMWMGAPSKGKTERNR